MPGVTDEQIRELNRAALEACRAQGLVIGHADWWPAFTRSILEQTQPKWREIAPDEWNDTKQDWAYAHDGMVRWSDDGRLYLFEPPAINPATALPMERKETTA